MASSRDRSSRPTRSSRNLKCDTARSIGSRIATMIFAAGFSAELGVGAMANHVQSRLIEDHVELLLPTWSVGVAWRKIALTWSSNTYGTRQRHIGLAFRFSPAAGSAEEECC